VQRLRLATELEVTATVAAEAHQVLRSPVHLSRLADVVATRLFWRHQQRDSHLLVLVARLGDAEVALDRIFDLGVGLVDDQGPWPDLEQWR
jgi:hypothetical protein